MMKCGACPRNLGRRWMGRATRCRWFGRTGQGHAVAAALPSSTARLLLLGWLLQAPTSVGNSIVRFLSTTIFDEVLLPLLLADHLSSNPERLQH